MSNLAYAKSNPHIAEIIAEQHYAEALLDDAAEIDNALAEGTAKVYDTPDELFKAWECEE
jgi:hypothetical protein